MEAPKPVLPHAQALRARTAIPYLGPDPAPSRNAGRAVVFLGVVSALLSIASGFVYLQRARLDRQILDGTLLDLGPYRANTALLKLTGLPSTLSVLVSVLVVTGWARRRRPLATLKQYGEAYVESPMRWILTRPVQVVIGICLLLFFLTGTLSKIDGSTSLAALAGRHTWRAVTYFCDAGYFLTVSSLVLVSERALRARLALSGVHRVGQVPIPYVPPIVTMQERLALEKPEPEGIGWMLRTAGLIFLLFIAVPGLVATLAVRTPAAVAASVGFLAVDVLVIRAFVRRFQASRRT